MTSRYHIHRCPECHRPWECQEDHFVFIEARLCNRMACIQQCKARYLGQKPQTQPPEPSLFDQEF